MNSNKTSECTRVDEELEVDEELIVERLSAKVEMLLARFGGMEPHEIAEFLLANGCYGRKIECDDCPMASYLKMHNCLVNIGYKFVYYDSLSSLGPQLTCMVPKNVSTFERRFDQGHYPFLDTTGMFGRV